MTQLSLPDDVVHHELHAIHWELVCSRNRHLLLVLSIGQDGQRGRPLLIPADALDAPSFRALSVMARSAGASGAA